MNCAARTAGTWLPGNGAALDFNSNAASSCHNSLPFPSFRQSRAQAQLASVAYLSQTHAFSPSDKIRKHVAARGIRSQTVSAPQAEIEKAADEFGKLTQVAAVLGTQWGDEGKGKLVDILAQRYDVVARCQVSFKEDYAADAQRACNVAEFS